MASHKLDPKQMSNPPEEVATSPFATTEMNPVKRTIMLESRLAAANPNEEVFLLDGWRAEFDVLKKAYKVTNSSITGTPLVPAFFINTQLEEVLITAAETLPLRVKLKIGNCIFQLVEPDFTKTKSTNSVESVVCSSNVELEKSKYEGQIITGQCLEGEYAAFTEGRQIDSLRPGRLNQDGYLIVNTSDTSFLVVIDGISEQGRGAKATALTSENIAYVLQFDVNLGLAYENAEEFLANAQKAELKEFTTTSDEFMGCCVNGAAISNNKMYFGHLGDVRAYLIRDENIIHKTTDHTHHIKKKAVTRSISARNGERLAEETDLSCEFDLHDKDLILLASDGLTRALVDDEIMSIIHTALSNNKDSDLALKEAVAELRKAVYAKRGNDPTVNDDITIVLYIHTAHS